MQELVALLKEKKYTIASIESLTAGLFASKMAEVSGASAVLKGGLVTYQTICKEKVLGIDPIKIETYGVISKEIADEMALKGAQLFQSDITVSFSGNAGPDVMDNKAVGLVHMAIVFKGNLYSYEHIFTGTRNEIREASVKFMCEKIKNLKNF